MLGVPIWPQIAVIINNNGKLLNFACHWQTRVNYYTKNLLLCMSPALTVSHTEAIHPRSEFKVLLVFIHNKIQNTNLR